MQLQANAVLSTLAREAELARALEALLETESGELAGADPGRIEALAARKLELTRQAADLARARNAALVEAGLPEGRRGLETACRAGGGEWRQRLDELLARAHRVRTLNDRNGALVDLRLRHTVAALGVLMRSGPEDTPVYSRDGLAHGGSVSRTRASA